MTSERSVTALGVLQVVEVPVGEREFAGLVRARLLALAHQRVGDHVLGLALAVARVDDGATQEVVRERVVIPHLNAIQSIQCSLVQPVDSCQAVHEAQ